MIRVCCLAKPLALYQDGLLKTPWRWARSVAGERTNAFVRLVTTGAADWLIASANRIQFVLNFVHFITALWLLTPASIGVAFDAKHATELFKQLFFVFVNQLDHVLVSEYLGADVIHAAEVCDLA